LQRYNQADDKWDQASPVIAQHDGMKHFPQKRKAHNSTLFNDG